jgi:hypothetical protein
MKGTRMDQTPEKMQAALAKKIAAEMKAILADYYTDEVLNCEPKFEDGSPMWKVEAQDGPFHQKTYPHFRFTYYCPKPDQDRTMANDMVMENFGYCWKALSCARQFLRTPDMPYLYDAMVFCWGKVRDIALLIPLATRGEKHGEDQRKRRQGKPSSDTYDKDRNERIRAFYQRIVAENGDYGAKKRTAREFNLSDKQISRIVGNNRT